MAERMMGLAINSSSRIGRLPAAVPSRTHGASGVSGSGLILLRNAHPRSSNRHIALTWWLHLLLIDEGFVLSSSSIDGTMRMRADSTSNMKDGVVHVA